ncbi:MAG: hypothetical protein ACP5QW_07690 [bacterium]
MSKLSYCIFRVNNLRKHIIIPVFMIILIILVLFCITSASKGTIYDLFKDTSSILNSMNPKVIHFKVNDQDMDMFVHTEEDRGALLSKLRNNKSLPFYRDKSGGLSVHAGGLNKHVLASPGSLMAIIEPVMGFVNGSSTKYVSLKLGNGFDAKRFMDTGIHDSDDFPVFPSAQRINTIKTEQFAIGHYKAQATAGAVLLYYDARLRAQGYRKLQQTHNMGLYQSSSNMFIVDVEEKSSYVSIITYSAKNK